ncbi:DUF3108 domain-containing protein [Luteimonas terricola]|uniref:DUF3108 domain-containing protein n=1 Tax=Luteimonas terricola TaxID=645597 RepID=A0ABQ2EGV5_9GAMM|nr:DUF3108 domain-containing protein [Luteimonas terricola]GGK11916.1 hypothetical protein GCM10011394_21520 [Luteimonas terricola]
MQNLNSIRGRAALVASSLLLALSAAPALAIEAFNADYQANYMGMEAKATMSLASAGKDRWQYRIDIGGMGAELEQSTVFEIDGKQWRPLKSVDSQRGTSGLAAMLVKRKTVTADYDWTRGEARWTGDVKADRAGPVKLREGDLDGMLMNLVLVRDVAAGKPLEYRLVEDGRVKRQSFQVAGKEAIEVGGKSHEATRVVRKDGKREIIAWVVDGLPVPARVLQRRDGKDHIDLRLTAVN